MRVVDVDALPHCLHVYSESTDCRSTGERSVAQGSVLRALRVQSCTLHIAKGQDGQGEGEVRAGMPADDEPDVEEKPVQALDAGDIALLKSYVRPADSPAVLPSAA